MVSLIDSAESKNTAAPCAMVIFGASGDLTHRKLIPALYNLSQDGLLPEQFKVIGVSRTPFSDEEFRAKLLDSVSTYSRRKVDPVVWSSFAKHIHYLPMDATKSDGYALLKSKLLSFDTEESKLNHLFYLSTSPEFFTPISTHLGAHEMARPKDGRLARLVIEKPFGHDLKSAQALNLTLRKSFKENQIYRIDHYLGKETVQNILVFRFANGIFEPMWSNQFVDHIQITVGEDIGVGTRAGYFDQSGIIRDMFQNHVLQMLALLCIEPPLSLTDANSIRDEKVKVLRSLRRFSAHDIRSGKIVRAQYSAGTVKGEDAAAYLEEKGVAPSSKTETFIALELEIDTWRWSGVPVFVRVGKRMPRKITELTIHFKKPPGAMFRGREDHLEENVLSIQIQPNEGIALKILSKPPGPGLEVQPVVMDFNYGHSLRVSSADAYERLILDSMKGDPTLFIRDDEIEEAWAFLEPIFEEWRNSSVPVYQYPAGSWGPKEADALLAKTGRRWRSL